MRFALIALILFGVPFAVWALADQPTCADVIRLLEKEENGAVSGHNEGTVTCERDCEVLFSFPNAADDESNHGYHDQNSKCDTANELDLLAQNSMAHWAKVSAGLALGALCGLFLTLWETRRIGQAQVRAYLSVSKADAAMGVDFLFINLTIANCGQSPAYDVAVNVTCDTYIRETLDIGTTWELDCVGRQEDKKTVVSIAANSSQPITTLTQEMDEETRRQFDGSYGIDLEVFGKVIWKDVFGDAGEQEFYFSLMGASIHRFLKSVDGKEPGWVNVDLLPGHLLRTPGEQDKNGD